MPAAQSPSSSSRLEVTGSVSGLMAKIAMLGQTHLRSLVRHPELAPKPRRNLPRHKELEDQAKMVISRV